MENQVLSIERMKHLQELGLDTSKASAVIYTISETESYCGYSRECILIEGYLENYLSRNSSFTLQDIFEMLPKEIINDEYNCLLTIFYNIHDNKWIVSYEDLDFSISNFCHETLIDAAYEMLCWCIENGHIKSK